MPEVTNDSGFAYESVYVTDEVGMPVFVAIVQSTWAIVEDGPLLALDTQPAVRTSGEWYGDPATTSLKLEPQIAFTKPATDIALVGYAYPSSSGSSDGIVGIRVGPVQKIARVFGDRLMTRNLGLAYTTTPQPFERIPIVYERCFGGWDRRHPDPGHHTCEPRNPVGVGFMDGAMDTGFEGWLPNFELTDQLFQGIGDTPEPAGFGFIQSHWYPRSLFAGTYDKRWSEDRKPLLPDDFDRRFFNAASPGLIAPGFLQGDEEVIVIGATPGGRTAFRLPGLPTPHCIVALRGRRSARLEMNLDTLLVDTDALTVTMTWRGALRLRRGPHDVEAVNVDPRPEEVEDLEVEEE